jgi:ubiquinone/menaquinone biosynthesis C-methylase UbiE
MSKERIKKFESKKRLKELNPYETLLEIGLEKDHVFCDIGAGTGIFSFAASGITSNHIYAVEIADEMIELLMKRKSEGGVDQLEVIKSSDPSLSIKENSVDRVLLSTVFHELEEPSEMLGSIKKIMKSNGLLAIIEFHKEETPMGPPVNHRISKSELEKICLNNNFTKVKIIDLGENLYLSIFHANKKITA